MENTNKKILIDNITHEYLQGLGFDELTELASEIRGFLIDKVSKTGGHLASNLGVVELTIMLHRCFDLEKDKLIFDVGHQSYVHKILTGRMSGFDKLRQFKGMSGFPKRAESKADLFDTGHSSTSISLASGVAEALKLKSEDAYTVAVIGDGAATGGLAFEALNNIGDMEGKVIVILNDNGMSISPNVGAISRYLTKVRTSSKYAKLKEATKEFLGSIPAVGEPLTERIRNAKNRFKYMVLPGTFVESMGIKYFGPVDGHNFKQLEFELERAKKVKGSVLIHIKTVKGKGYKRAEKSPESFHGVGAFDIKKGPDENKNIDFSCIAGKKLCELASENKRIVAICPSMTKGCGLTEFSKEYPDRYFDCGITEGYAVTFAAGMAEEGFIPVVCTYSSFYQRAFDMVLHDAAINNFHVVFCIDRAGLVGADGETHQGIFDLSFLGCIPNLAILSPASFNELEEMLSYACLEHKGPIAIRYPKGRDTGIPGDFKFGSAAVLKEGKDITLCAEGQTVKDALEAAECAQKEGISAEVINLCTIKPLDIETIKKSILKTKRLITLEANTKKGGIGQEIFSQLKVSGIIKAYPDAFIPQGTVQELKKLYKMDSQSIVQDIKACVRGEFDEA
ncbi:MAG: 1-deoxy-D-xylulose-5-phosphate synthase [Bacillota bacterium]|nr:1-deoxy-D-xylulose-5-phosphate synthase [Bacillota bacterium]